MTIVATPGQPTSNAYVTLAAFKAYCDERGLAYPTTSGADDQIEAAIIRGASYLDNRNRNRWKGRKVGGDQSMAWPRVGVCDEDGYPVDSEVIPAVVVQANVVSALRIINGVNLEPDLDRGGAVKRTRDRAGPVETETEYRDDASARIAVTEIDGLLAGVLLSGNLGRLLRA